MITDEIRDLVTPRAEKLQGTITVLQTDISAKTEQVEALQRELDLANSILSALGSGSNGASAPVEQEKPGKYKLYGREVTWLAKQKPGRTFTARSLVNEGACGTMGSANGFIWRMNHLGKIEKTGGKFNGLTRWRVL